MALFSIGELIDLVVMIAAVGFIFKDSFMPVSKKSYEPLRDFGRNFDLENIKFAIAVTAPAIVLHELGHKFASLVIGIPATFHASYLWLIIGVGLKLVGFPFIFFVPGFVTHAGGTPIQNALIGFAGPLVNLILWIGPYFILKTRINRKYVPYLYVTQQINMFLFIFNMIPLPPFDGWNVLNSLINLV
ncbi:M50 family metallopeptidase [Candidatus Woesearchaeota archaeon]|nr:M50 family metallopeptidase [Candidatus Woesearchaeota archaeon]